MNLRDVPTDAIRKELHKRDEAERAASWAALRAAHPCPECGGDPDHYNKELVEDFVFAPQDSEGVPMLYAPYEMGETKGGRFRTTITCVNGHVSYSDEIKWFDKPHPGPILSSRRREP